MNAWDESIIRFLNGYVSRVPELDSLMGHLLQLNLLKGGVLIGLIWWVWFDETKDQAEHRALLISTMVGACGSMITARVLALILPFRCRPIHDVELQFELPLGMDPGRLTGWSSFPSDHAALYFSLAFGLFLVSRPIGVLALMHASIVIAFPRVYLGLHFPSDIVGGAAIAAAMVALSRTEPIKRLTIPPALRISARYPAAFYTGFMLVSAQLIVLFNDARVIGELTYKALIRLFMD